MFDKVTVNGSSTHPIFRFLKANTKATLGAFIKWNFTKFLVNRNGQAVERFGPAIPPYQLIPAIEKLL